MKYDPMYVLCTLLHCIAYFILSQARVKNSVHEGGGTPPGQTPPPADIPHQTATAADVTHPTGMHSCSKIYLVQK